MNTSSTRREFLQQTTQSSMILGAAAVLGGVHAFGNEKPAKLRLGIIGCGGIMTHHVKGLVDRRDAASLAWLCDVDPAQIERMGKQAGKLLKEGIIGEVKVARAWTAETRTVEKPQPDGTPPGGADYDRWLGPAPKRPFNPHRWHQTWRMFSDYGNGEIGDDGIHDLDLAAWGLGITTLPKQITARGGRMLLDGHASEYPDNMNVTYEYPDGRLLIYENYPFTAYGLHGFDNGNVFYGTEGYMIFSRRGAFSVFQGPKGTPGPTEGKQLRGQRGYAEHMAEFLNAIRQRTPTKASAEVAHRSCALVHLGEIAFRTRGRIDFDPQTERFIDCDEANALLTKRYRAPYVLPEVA